MRSAGTCNTQRRPALRQWAQGVLCHERRVALTRKHFVISNPDRALNVRSEALREDPETGFEEFLSLLDRAFDTLRSRFYVAASIENLDAMLDLLSRQLDTELRIGHINESGSLGSTPRACDRRHWPASGE